MATVADTATRGRPRRPRGVAVRARLGSIAWGTLAWFAGIVFFFPVLWMVITSFKPESAAYTSDPKFDFSPTLSEYKQVFDAGMGPFLANSAIATVMSVLLVLVLATPAAYALSLRPVGKWRDALFFFISTKMLPIVAAIVPIYLAVREVGLLDTIPTLIILYTAMNLPIAVWMMRSFFLEVPGEILEAARMDGADLRHELTEVVLPVVAPGPGRDRAHLRDLLLERVLLRREPDLDPGGDDAGVPRRVRVERGVVLGQAGGRGDDRLGAGADRGLDRPAPARARPVDGSDQVMTTRGRSRRWHR